MSLCPLGDFELISDHEEYEKYEKYEEYEVKITHCSGESATD